MGPTREWAALLFEGVEAGLDKSAEAADAKDHVRKIRREFELDDEPIELIADYTGFREALETLVYRRLNGVQEP